MITRRLLLALTALALVPPLVAAPAQPNIVFIIADDLGWADVDFHGGNAPTPNLDRLRKEGLELTQHYVAPVCTPTRAGLLSGRYWSRFGVTNPNNARSFPFDTETLPRALKKAGYDTCLTGKWHLGSKPEWGPNHFGFDHSYGSLAGGVGPWNHFYKKGEFSVTWHRNEELITEEGHVTDLITREAIQWLEGRGDAPFFLYVPYTAIHLPIKEPQDLLDRVPASITGEVARHYAACIIHLDDSVGKIVEALKRTGLAEDTLLVFTSDNGGSTAENNDTKYPEDDYPQGPLTGNNLPLRGKKGDVFEGGIRVPTILHWTGQLKPGTFDSPAHIVDWMPTFCALAGHTPETNLKWDGQNLWPQLIVLESPAPRRLYWQGPGFRSKAVRVGDWKLTAHQSGKEWKEELFDLSTDPNENANLAKSKPEKLAGLREAMEAFEAGDRDAVAGPDR